MSLCLSLSPSLPFSFISLVFAPPSSLPLSLPFIHLSPSFLPLPSSLLPFPFSPSLHTSLQRHQVCYLCGEADHISSRCPNDLCNYCYQKKHQKRPCSAPWSSPKTQCLRCFMTGHHAAVSWSCDLEVELIVMLFFFLFFFLDVHLDLPRYLETVSQYHSE